MGKIEILWIVTRPTKESVLADILFECDIDKLQKQFAGGLTANEILGIYVKPKEAEAVAMEALQERDAMGTQLTGTIMLEFSFSLEYFTVKKEAEIHTLNLICHQCKEDWQHGWIRPIEESFKPVYKSDK